MTEPTELKLVEVLRKTRNRRDPIATHGKQQFIYIVSNAGKVLYVGLSASPMIRLRQHYNRPHESELGHHMRNDMAGYCLDWTCTFVSASGGFAEEGEMIERLHPAYNDYHNRKPVQSSDTKDEPPESDF